MRRNVRSQEAPWMRADSSSSAPICTIVAVKNREPTGSPRATKTSTSSHSVP